ncbi:MAG: HU family DNA-binding protein [Acidimicrobiia bacterium]
MNRRELVLALAERSDMDRKTADAVLSNLVDVITERVAKGEPVMISGFAKFARVDRKARMGRNPQTGEPVKIKASRRARITALKQFKDAVLTGKVAAKPAAKKATKKVAKKTTKKAATKKAATKKVAKRAPARKAATKATRRPAKRR